MVVAASSLLQLPPSLLLSALDFPSYQTEKKILVVYCTAFSIHLTLRLNEQGLSQLKISDLLLLLATMMGMWSEEGGEERCTCWLSCCWYY